MSATDKKEQNVPYEVPVPLANLEFSQEASGMYEQSSLSDKVCENKDGRAISMSRVQILPDMHVYNCQEY